MIYKGEGFHNNACGNLFNSGGKLSWQEQKQVVRKQQLKDPNFYAKIGAKGGRNSRTGGFAANPALARIAGAKGGRISRRRKTTAVSAD